MQPQTQKQIIDPATLATMQHNAKIAMKMHRRSRPETAAPIRKKSLRAHHHHTGNSGVQQKNIVSIDAGVF